MVANRASGRNRSGKRSRGCEGDGMRSEMRRLGMRKTQAGKGKGPPKRMYGRRRGARKV